MSKRPRRSPRTSHPAAKAGAEGIPPQLSAPVASGHSDTPPSARTPPTAPGALAGLGLVLLTGALAVSAYLAWSSLAGVAVAWYAYLRNPTLPEEIRRRVNGLYQLLVRKYFFDEFYERFVPRVARGIGTLLWRVGDVVIIDGGLVNGSARLVGWFSAAFRQAQTGYLYHYAFVMIIGLSVLLGWILLRA